MNRDRIAGTWKQWSGAALQGWARLLRDDRRYAAALRRRRVGRTQRRCGLARDVAERRARELRVPSLFARN